MKKTILMTLSIYLVSRSVFGFGVGDIVSDPTSYSYYAEQIKTAKESLDSAKEQLKTALEAKDIAESTQKNLEGTYRRAQRAISDFKAMKSELSNDSLGFAEKMIRDRRDLEGISKNTVDKVDRVFNPARKSFDDISELAGKDDNGKYWSPTWQGVKSAKTKIVRNELKKAVSNAEIVSALAASQLENIEDLSIKANSAMTQKDATDITNALLLQLIDQNQQMLKLVGDMSRNFAITKLSENNYEAKDLYKSIKEKMDDQDAKSHKDGYQWGSYLKDRLKEY